MTTSRNRYGQLTTDPEGAFGALRCKVTHMAYAHAVIEVTRDANDPAAGVVVYQRGDEVPDDLSGIKELRKHGSVRKEQYDASAEPVQVPDFVEIDGVRYVKTGDGAKTGEASNA